MKLNILPLVCVLIGVLSISCAQETSPSKCEREDSPRFTNPAGRTRRSETTHSICFRRQYQERTQRCLRSLTFDFSIEGIHPICGRKKREINDDVSCCLTCENGAEEGEEEEKKNGTLLTTTTIIIIGPLCLFLLVFFFFCVSELSIRRQAASR